MFKSINETERFSYEDCVLTGMERAADGLILDVEALIVKENNSQNTNFTESYAGPAKIKFVDSKIIKLIKVGYKYFNADGLLIKSVPDEMVPESEWTSLLKTFPGNYLPYVGIGNDCYDIEIEMTEEDGTQGNSYLIVTTASSVVVTWDKYLNRVGR